MSFTSTILIVDDEPIGRETIEDLLSSENYRLEFAEDGPEAIRSVSQNPPDLILLDVMLPGMDGFDVCKQLRSNPSTAEIPIILVTALDDHESRLRGIEAGADDFISKPYNRTELRARIRTITKLNRYRSLHIERKKFESLFNQSPDAILIVNYDGKIIDFNPVLLRLTGLENGSSLPKKLSGLFHEKDQALLDHLFNLALQPNSSKQSFEAALISSINDYLPVEVLLINFPLPESPAIQVIIHDISKQIIARERIQQQYALLNGLFKSGESILSNLEFGELAKEIADICVNTLGVCTAMIGKINQSEWDFVAQSGEECAVFRKSILNSQSLISQLSQPDLSKPLIFTRFSSAQLLGIDHLGMIDSPVMSSAFIPLLSRRALIGILVLSSKEEYFFNPERINVFKTFANQAAAALENARLFAQTEERLQHLQALRNVDMAITSSMDLETTYLVLVEQVLNQTGASLCEILLLDHASMTLRKVVSRGTIPSPYQQNDIQITNTLCGQVVLSRKILKIPSLLAYPHSNEIKKTLNQEAYQAYVGMPVISKGKIRGVLHTFYDHAIEFDNDRISLLEAFASQAAIAAENIHTHNEIQQENTNLILALDSILISWAISLELRKFEPTGHSQRTADITLQLAQLVGVPKDQLIHLWRGALLHDIGKISIPDEVLLKPGTLTETEWEVIRKHPLTAKKLLDSIQFLNPAKPIPISHHERWDGSGYPEGLKGEEIPLSARIFMVVEVYDALTSDQPYRPAWTKEQAIKYLSENSGILFDPNIVQKFLYLLQNNKLYP